MTDIRFTSFPRTEPAPSFLGEVVNVFKQHEIFVSTKSSAKNLKSDEVLKVLREDLEQIGFSVESGKKSCQKVKRPVFFGENSEPSLQYEIDAYHEIRNIGLEIEAARALGGNALYRDIVQALVMVDLEFLIVAVPLEYRYGKSNVTRDYQKAVAIADALYSHSRIIMPYGMGIIGY
ncbi:hypothetical protein [Maridesulfovibrio sp. FT414]|uniref:hypothetical protein n=1 Tax=Maridesulfovibrio sp. FT414 TaxID=2979469 RepID=UPI003D801B96